MQMRAGDRTLQENPAKGSGGTRLPRLSTITLQLFTEVREMDQTPQTPKTSQCKFGSAMNLRQRAWHPDSCFGLVEFAGITSIQYSLQF